ncbi:hypothetical protein [Pseudogemmobacter sonorensis]|uniref:hypothetical protein n=1 Tax=Pseudogemmobacter sonorensis TaxID=2989681 RepID=UPI0036AEE67D
MSSIMSGIVSLAISVLTGQPVLVWLLSYTLAGCCGLLAFVLLNATQAEDRLQRSFP